MRTHKEEQADVMDDLVQAESGHSMATMTPPRSLSPNPPRSLATPENGVDPAEGAEAYAALVEMWFLFCIIWGVGGPLDEDGRKKFDAFMREMDTRYPR